MVWILSAVHLEYLETWEKCGCETCLAQNGLRRSEVFDPTTGHRIVIVTPLPLGPCDVDSYSPCSVLPRAKNELPNWRLPYKD